MSVRAMLFATRKRLQVTPSDSSVSGLRVGADCYAGTEFNTDGIERKTAITGGPGFTVSLGDWLDDGFNTEVWVLWHRTGGSLGDWNSLDPGEDVRLQLSSNRQFRIIKSSTGTATLIGYFEMWDAATGGTKLVTTGSRTFLAEREP